MFSEFIKNDWKSLFLNFSVTLKLVLGIVHTFEVKNVPDFSLLGRSSDEDAAAAAADMCSGLWEIRVH